MSAPRAILYDRVSTVIQSTNYSGGKDGYQLEKCRAYCAARGWPIVGEISDVDSGADMEIDGLLEAVERAERREYDKLVVHETSRFARDLAKKVVYEADLKRHGVQVVYLNLPEGEGEEVELMSDLMGALDSYDRKRIRKKLMDGIQKKARGGKVVGAGVAPYGYQYVTAWSDAKRKPVPIGLEPHPERADVAVRIFRAATTTTLGDLARVLTEDGIPTPTGRGARWTAGNALADAQETGLRRRVVVWRYRRLGAADRRPRGLRRGESAARRAQSRPSGTDGRRRRYVPAARHAPLRTLRRPDLDLEGVALADRRRRSARAHDVLHVPAPQTRPSSQSGR